MLIRVWVYMHNYVHTHTHAHTHTHTHTHVFTHTLTHTYTYTCVHTHTNTYTHLLWPFLSMMTVHSRKWVILEHSATHGWNNQYAIGTVSDNAYSRIYFQQRAGLYSFIALCSYENNSSLPHSILGNHIPVCNIDTKFHHERLALVHEVKLGSFNVTCALRQLPM